MARHEFPRSVKVAAFDRCKGSCERCTARLYVGKYHYDHRIPDQMGGEPTLENCTVLCVACHGEKTAKHDVPAIARAKRREAKHIGAKSKGKYRWPKRSFSSWRPTP